jgi:hypothetical protein
MKTLIEGYEIFPGEHCGSSSLRGLLKHYSALELPESAIFGLGAGVDCMYFESDELDPKISVFGRTGSMEADVGRCLDIDYRERPEADDAEAWQVVREEVLAGRPTMLSGDILYLDYREYKVHFPGHRFVLLGFDDATEKAFIADRIRPVVEACSYAGLMKSRNPPEGLSTHNLWGRFHGTEIGRSLADAARVATRLCATRMLGLADGRGAQSESADAGASNGNGVDVSGMRDYATGIAGIRRLAESLPKWAEREDAAWLASFNGRSIEKFGNGGGNFRRLYAGFLEWARGLDPKLVPVQAPALASEAADGWTRIAALLGQAAEGGAGDPAWSEAARLTARVADLEQTLFEQLADRAA